MTANEFNEKWKSHLEEKHYGMAIEHEKVIEYLDVEFEKEVKINPSFQYSQIKMKFGTSRVYATSNKTTEWENKINDIFYCENLF